MIRGEFHFMNGLIVPNNITLFGAQSILTGALRDSISDFHIGLCNAVFEPELAIQDVTEPTLATNGYARLAVERSIVGWPSGGLVNDEPFLESKALVWTPVGGPFDQPVTRMFITPESVATIGDIFCLSAPMPTEVIFDPETPEPDRTFKYRIFLR
jgi:hypothetical protein